MGVGVEPSGCWARTATRLRLWVRGAAPALAAAGRAVAKREAAAWFMARSMLIAGAGGCGAWGWGAWVGCGCGCGGVVWVRMIVDAGPTAV